MSVSERIGRIFRRRGALPAGTSLSPSTAPRQAVNDAEAYGVTVEPAEVTAGGWYWQASHVHHLSAEENQGQRMLFVDLLDSQTATPQNPAGGRVFGGNVRVRWDGEERIVGITGSSAEPGGQLTIEPSRVLTVEALGLPGEKLPTDRVCGIHTSHPDEALGNTLLHHSFSVTFVKVRAPETVMADSVIYGVFRQAAGREVVLLKDEAIVASAHAGDDDTFRFTDLPAGEYVVAVAGARCRSHPVRVNGRSHAQLDLALVFAESELSGQVRNGAGRTLRLTRVDVEPENQAVASQLVAADGAYCFAGLPAGAYRVALADSAVISPVVTLSGVDSARIDLVAPARDKPLAHYVLFGPPSQAATVANLVLAQDFILAFKPAFGFSAAEAASACGVTIVADYDAVGPDVEAQLDAEGIPYQRIRGTVEEIANALAARVADGQVIATQAV